MDILDKLRKKRPLTVVGLMSGTSMDGLDICTADLDFHGESVQFVIRGFRSETFPLELRESIKASLSGPTGQVCELHYELGRFFAEKTAQFVSELHLPGIDAVGMHGQTVHHISGKATLQIGEPSFLAEVIGAPVISDFRARDISVGGSGAPLIPIVDKWIFQKEYEAILCLNLGGIANVTYLPPSLQREEVLGFDTGPGMALLDEAIASLSGERYDDNGSLASTGEPDVDLVDGWMLDEFISREPPKSTGRDYFGLRWLEKNVPDLSQKRAPDLLASLSLFTARSVVVNCDQFIGDKGLRRVVVSGGGIHHSTVMKMLTEEFSPIEVLSSEALGVHPDLKESLGFAILAAAFFKGIPGNVPSVTGASRSVVLGKLTL